MKLQTRIKKLEEKLQRIRAELSEAYEEWDHSERELRSRIDFLLAGISALQDMLDEATEENWELAQFSAELLAENSVLSRQVGEQAVVIAELNAQLATTCRQVL